MYPKRRCAVRFRSILIAGLVAGLVINILGIALVPILGDEMSAILASRGLPALGVGAALYFVSMSLVLGCFLVWLYGLAIGQMGRGPRTAVIVACVIWFFTYFWSNAALVVYGFLPFSLAAIGTAWGLVELVVAGIVGARIYERLA